MVVELNSPIDRWLPPVDNTEIPQDQLNIEDKTRRNLLPWKGQFSPQLIEVLLKTYSFDGCQVLYQFSITLPLMKASN
ncbi:hypothetical protein [Baaleninema sp.]|uniref:hypothetical protein n=1 Tax=Baaleninema sp. TaxID=3101197 RepID=UPI003D09004A